MQSSTPTLSPTAPAVKRKRPCPVCEGRKCFLGKSGQTIECGWCAPAAPERLCGACQQPFSPQELRQGRGRSLGEHPRHVYAPCGHSISWHGSSLTTWGCQQEIVRAVARLDEAALLEIRDLPAFRADALPLTLCAAYAQLEGENERFAGEWLLWAVTERLKDLADEINDAWNRAVEQMNAEQCRYGDRLDRPTPEGLRIAA